MEMILLKQMDKVLERFYASVCKQDGTDYEPGSLNVMQAALYRHLKKKKRWFFFSYKGQTIFQFPKSY